MVDPKDEDAILASMRLLSDPGTAARLGEAAYRRSRVFTWQAVGQRLLRALAGLPAEPLDAYLAAA